jgi:hypothetical protein
MKKNGLYFLAAAVLAAMVFGACAASFDPSGDTVEYDAQGRRLVTVTIDLEGASRAVNLGVAKTYINFYEVVFERDGSEYYSATTTKGAGKRLSLRVPVVGTYRAYLNAGYLEDGNDAVLLAQAAASENGTAAAGNISGGWTFTLGALALQVKGATDTIANTDPIYVQIAGGAATTYKTTAGIPYYTPAATQAVAVTVTTGVENVVDYAANNVSVVPLIRKTDVPPVTIAITASPAFDTGTGKLTFGFTAPGAGTIGVSNIGFDVEVAAVAATRDKGAPVRWHIRNGLDVEDYDNGAADYTNTGAGIVFAFGGALPKDEDTYINLSPPAL